MLIPLRRSIAARRRQAPSGLRVARLLLLPGLLLLGAGVASAAPPPPAKAAKGQTPASKLASKTPASKTPDVADARWPVALKDRMSRYASLGRATDAEGDFREVVRARMSHQRVDDPRGDRYERWKLVLHENDHSETRYASLRRQLDPAADVVEHRLAKLSVTRGKADLRRIKLIPKEELAELARFNREFVKYGDPRETSGDRVGIAQGRGDADALRRSEGTTSRRDERMADPEDRDRYQIAEREREGRHSADSELDERREERLAEKLERKGDVDADKKERKDEVKAERKEEVARERKADKAADRAAEAETRTLEHAEERSLDKTLNKEEIRD